MFLKSCKNKGHEENSTNLLSSTMMLYNKKKKILDCSSLAQILNIPCDCQKLKAEKNQDFGYKHLKLQIMQHTISDTEPKNTFHVEEVTFNQFLRCHMKSTHLYLSVNGCLNDDVGMQGSQIELGLNLRALSWCEGVSLTILYNIGTTESPQH